MSIAASCLAACASPGDRRGRPLYAEPREPLARSEVAVLSGHVAEVDGRDVSDDSGIFEVLPGCHVVRTPAEWAVHDAESVLMAETGIVPFALRMKGGHSYEIKVRTSGPTAPVGTFVVEAIESDPAGNTAQVFAPAGAEADLDACRAQQPVAEGRGSRKEP